MSAWSPCARTRAMISLTVSRTASGAGISPLSAAAVRAGWSLAVSRSHRIESFQESVDRLGLELVRHRVGDQPGGALRDLLPDHEPVFSQRRTARGEVDDALGQPGQRRQLDRPLDLDDLHLAPGLEEVPGGGARVL